MLDQALRPGKTVRTDEDTEFRFQLIHCNSSKSAFWRMAGIFDSFRKLQIACLIQFINFARLKLLKIRGKLSLLLIKSARTGTVRGLLVLLGVTGETFSIVRFQNLKLNAACKS